MVEWVDVNVHIVSCGNVDKGFSHPICPVNNVLFSPVDFVVPVTDHLPCGTFDLVRNLARFDIDSLGLVDGVSGKCSPVLNILGVDEVLAPSDCVVCSPVLTRLINSDCALVQLVSQHSYLLSQHANLFPGSEGGNPVGNRNLNSFPYDLLNGLVRHIEGVSGTENVKGFIDVVESGGDDSIEITLESFVVSGETISTSGLNDLVCKMNNLILDALKKFYAIH